MKNLILTLSFFFLIISLSKPVSAQFTSKEEKELKKAGKLADNSDFNKAAETLMPVLAKHENSTELWNTLVDYRYKDYLAKKNSRLNFTVTATNADGTPSTDSNTTKLVNLLRNMDLSRSYYDEFIRTCKRAELVCENPTAASMYLRYMFIDPRTDSVVSEKAIRFFNKAEDAFAAKNFDDAIKYYKKALEIEPRYYKAGLYLGDVYYLMHDYPMAAKYFREARDKEPSLMEPRKYLVDALAKMGKYDEALEEAKNALLLYTDAALFLKIEDIAAVLSKKYDRQWVPRRAPVNIVAEDTLWKEEDKKQPEGAWKYYVEARQAIIPYCNADGTIKSGNPLTKQKYLEAYCWEYMLKKDGSDEFAYARKMMEGGMLDCYVLYSVGQFDLYSQAQHLAKHEPDRVKRYLQLMVQ